MMMKMIAQRMMMMNDGRSVVNDSGDDDEGCERRC